MQNKNISSMFRSRSRAIALEPRLLFDGAGAVAAVDGMDDFDFDDQHNDGLVEDVHEAGSEQQNIVNDGNAIEIIDGDDSLHIPSSLGSRLGLDTEQENILAGTEEQALLIIDSRVDNYELLLESVGSSVQVIVVDEGESGLDVLSNALANSNGYDAIHIISHGTPGSFTLGTDQIDSSAIQQNSEQLQSWANHLNAGADILLYGCDVAQGEAGQSFIEQLAAITGADIAASINPTGNAEYGGDWILESETGSIEAQVMEFDAMQGVLDDGPVLESIVRQTPSFATTNAETVTFRVTFNEGVTGVTGSSFVIAPGSISGATIQLVSQVDAAGTQFDVVISGLSGTGTLNIDLAAVSGITSNDGNSRLVTTTNPADGKPDHSYTIDRQINPAHISGLEGGNVQGSTITTKDNNNLVFGGTADPGDTVRLYIGSTLLGTAKADSNGEWSMMTTSTVLAEGSYSVVIRSSDAAGNTAVGSATLIIDTTAPEVIPSSKVSDIIVTLDFDDLHDLDAGQVPDPNDFLVTLDGADVLVSRVVIDGKSVRLTLNTAASHGQSVKVTYQGTALRDAVGNPVEPFNNLELNNATNPSNTAPTFDSVPSLHQWYSLGDDAKVLFNGNFVLQDNDDTFLENATIQIVNNRDAADVLAIKGSLPKGIEASFDSATGTLTLTGHANMAAYQMALGQITFKTTGGVNQSRTISVTVHDGQTPSAATTREMRVLGAAFSIDESTTSYLVGNVVGGSYQDLVGVNLVMGTLETIAKIDGGNFNDFNSGSLNGLGFNPIDGHLYASSNSGVVRIDADGEVTQVTAYSGTKTPSGIVYTADIDNHGIMWLYQSNNFYLLDLNPQSDTFQQWLDPIRITSNQPGSDMAFNAQGDLYSANTNALRKIDVTRDADGKPLSISTSSTTISGVSSAAMQYFDNNGYFYFNRGSSDRYEMGRINLATNTLEWIKADPNKQLPTTGDAARIATINLDFGDAPDTYKTSMSEQGPRHSQLGSKVSLGEKPNGYEMTGTASAAADSDDDDGVVSFPKLRQEATSYSVDVIVNNESDKPAKLIAWLDMDGDGKFSVNEAVTYTVPAGTKNGTQTVTWNISGVNGLALAENSTTYARFRITSETETLGKTTDLWSDSYEGTIADVNGHDPRSYGARMDGEVEDYAITVMGPDPDAPFVITVEVGDGDTGPRYTPVGEVKVTFNEPVRYVDVDDFILTRDGVPVTLPSDTPIRQDSSDPAIWYIDLGKLTNPTGEYELVVKNGSSDPTNPGEATIHDDAGNNLAQGGNVTFIIDNTAPMIDLDSGDDTTRDHTSDYTAGQAPSVSLDNSTANHEATVEEKSDRVTQVEITVGGLRDGDDEVLVFGDIALKANGSNTSQNLASPTTAKVGGVEVIITYAAGKFTLTPATAGGAESQPDEMSAEDAQAIVRDISYKNAAGIAATNGNRTFAFTATDKAGATATPAIATIAVTGGNGANGPDVPTVVKQVTNDTTPTIKGEAKVPDNGTLTVTVNGKDYTWTKGGDNTNSPLEYNPVDHTWTLEIPDDDEMPEGKYDVTATVTPDGGSPVEDLTSEELIIDLTPPDTPDVTDQVTHDTTPVITGEADVRDDEILTVSVTIGGKTYTYTEGTPEGDKHLKRDNNKWSVTLPDEPQAVMTPGESYYQVTATVKDAAGNVSEEGIGTIEIKRVTVSNPTVNEGSGYAVFEVEAIPGSTITLDLQDDQAQGKGVDFGVPDGAGTGLEYWDGSQWVAYAAGAVVSVDSKTGKLQVRTPITNDDISEGSETFKLVATPVYGTERITDNTGEGTGTIVDDGTGTIWVPVDPTNPNEKPTDPTDPGLELIPIDPNQPGKPDVGQPIDPANPEGPKVPVLDDDRPLSINDITVNEGSGYGVFVVEGTAGQKVTLELTDDTAKGGTDPADTSGDTDYLKSFEYFDGSKWVTYTAGELVEIPAGGKLQVRVAIINDDVEDSGEKFTLTATNTGGKGSTGEATIKDDGTGTIWVPVDPNNPNVEPTDPTDPGLELVPVDPNQPGKPDVGQPIDPDNPEGPKVPVLDDDRPLSINDITVNEGSGYGVFVVEGTAGQKVTLELTDDTAKGGTDPADTSGDTDYLKSFEYFDGSKWVTYTAGELVEIPVGGKLQVRVAIINDDVEDSGEKFTLTATNTGGKGFTGEATIKDDGTGTIWVPVDPNNPNVEPTDPTDPGLELVPVDPNQPGKPDVGQPIDPTNPEGPKVPVLDDDRPLSINDITVNEGSGYGVFVVEGTAGQKVTLELTDDTAKGGTDPADTSGDTDYLKSFEYFDGSKWVTYTAGELVEIPVGGKLQVRVAIINDDVEDSGEKFTLTATNTGGKGFTGEATIKDDGTGTIWVPVDPNNPNVEPTDPTDPGLELVPVDPNQPGKPDVGQPIDPTNPEGPKVPVLDDDRPVTVNDITVNESSPYGVFEVTGVPGQKVTFELEGDTATGGGVDFGSKDGSGLEYSVDGGKSWIKYDGTPVENTTGTILVRTPIINDEINEGPETFELKVTPVGGRTTTGTGTIVDDGTGTIWVPVDPNNPNVEPTDPTDPGLELVPVDPNQPGKPDVGQPIDPANPEGPKVPVLDDDRPVTVNDITVNESSPYGVFEVTGVPGQKVTFELEGDTATGGGVDFGSKDGSGLEYSVDGGKSWAKCDGTPVENMTGTILVRTPIVNDDIPEEPETFELKVTPVGGQTATGKATIYDDGRGDILDPNTGKPLQPGDNGYPEEGPNNDHNQPPTVKDHNVIFDEELPAKGNLLEGSTDPDGDALTVIEIIVDGKPYPVPSDGKPITIEVPGKGTLVVDKTGDYTFTAKPGVIGQIPDIGYKVSDGKGGEDQGNLKIQIRPGNPPVAPPVTNVPNDGNYSPLGGTPEITRMKGLTDSAVITDPSVFYEGERHDDVRRLPIPLQPIVYVNNEVATAQQQRHADDMRADSSPAHIQPFAGQSISLAMGLGQDRNLFVSHAVRDTQRTAAGLDSRVTGRLSRVDLSADDMLASNDLRSMQFAQVDADEAEKAKQKRQQAAQVEENEGREDEVALQEFDAEDADIFAEQQSVMPVAASFTEQLRGSSKHLPFAAREKNFLI